MRSQLLNTVTVLVLMASAAACTRLPPESHPGTPGSVALQMLDDSLSIPAEWGTLAGVDNNPTYTRLWFEDEEGTIRLVAYNHYVSHLRMTVAVIRRR